jgi:hypothetical protein
VSAIILAKIFEKIWKPQVDESPRPVEERVRERG